MEKEYTVQDSLQEIFDKVLNRARKQKCASTEVRGTKLIHSSCMYRNQKGNACFVGALIKDIYYDSSFETCAFPRARGNR